MTQESYFNKVRDFLEQKEISKKVVEHLNDDIEIGILIEKLECSFFKANKNPKLEKRKAKKPDIVFALTPEAVDILSKYSGNSVGEFGVEILKQYLAGGIKINIVGSITNILTHGYLGIAKEGGKEFAKFLTAHGITGLAKWTSLIQKLKSRA